MDKGTVLGVIRVALGTETNNGWVFLVLDDAHDPVGGDGVLVQHEGDGLPLGDGVGVDLFHINQRARVIRRLHGAGQHGEHLQSNDPRAHQQERQDYHQRHQNGTDGVPDFLERAAHSVTSSPKTSAFTFGTTKL